METLKEFFGARCLYPEFIVANVRWFIDFPPGINLKSRIKGKTVQLFRYIVQLDNVRPVWGREAKPNPHLIDDDVLFADMPDLVS